MTTAAPSVTRRFVDGLEIFSCLPKENARSAQTGRPLPPVLFIHGAFAGGWMWIDTFMPALACAGIESHALSLRGHGESFGREAIDWHSIANFVDDVEAAVATLSEVPVLVGHSMGGFIAQKALERWPAPAVALLCSVPPQGLLLAQTHLMMMKPGLFMDINRILGGFFPGTETLREALFAGHIEEATLTAWLQRMQPESHRAIWDMSAFHLPDTARMHRPPMLIIGAEYDALLPAWLATLTAQCYGQNALIFPGMGHALTHDQGWEQVAATLVDWLNKLSITP